MPPQVGLDPISTIISIGFGLIGGRGGLSGFVRNAVRETRAAQEAERNAASVVAVPMPVPAPPPAPVPTNRTPPIFRGGPAANDPVYRQIGARGLGRILGPGSLIITAVEVAIEAMRRAQDRRAQEIIDRQDEDIRNRRRRQARDDELREVTIRGLGTDPRSQPVDLPGRPEPSPLPPTPRPVWTPDPIFLPEIELPLPRVGAGDQPLELPNPGDIPLPVPPAAPNVGAPAPARRAPVPSPFPFEFPLQLPRISPRGVPVPSPRTLTPVQPQSVASPYGFAMGLPDANPVPQPDLARDRCRPRRCDDDLEDDRTQCFKGLYREGLRDTDYTQWVEVDCITGSEI